MLHLLQPKTIKTPFLGFINSKATSIFLLVSSLNLIWADFYLHFTEIALNSPVTKLPNLNSNLCFPPQSNNTSSLLFLELFISLGFQKTCYSGHSFITRYLLWPLGFSLGPLLILYASHLWLIHSLIWINDLNYLLYTNNSKSLSLILTSFLTSLITNTSFQIYWKFASHICYISVNAIITHGSPSQKLWI